MSFQTQAFLPTQIPEYWQQDFTFSPGLKLSSIETPHPKKTKNTDTYLSCSEIALFCTPSVNPTIGTQEQKGPSQF